MGKESRLILRQPAEYWPAGERLAGIPVFFCLNLEIAVGWERALTLRSSPVGAAGAFQGAV
jgi:hypothetical protein